MILIMIDDVLKKKEPFQTTKMSLEDSRKIFMFFGQNVKFLPNLFMFENGLDIMFKIGKKAC